MNRMQLQSQSTLDRRSFLAGAAALPALLATGGQSVIAQDQPAQGLIERVRDPQNLEFPFHTLDGFIVPNNRFFARCHFPIPTLDARTWRLRVEGAVNRELEFTLEQLRAMAPRSVTATLECAGNSRALATPPLRGVAWEQGAVGNAEWSGIPLAALLDRAGVGDRAVDVVLEGADRGEVTAEPRPQGQIAYARSLPLAKARHEATLLALRMNDAELPAAHGFPVRAVVPGWYGMASVKWLTRIIVTESPFQGFWQTADYSYFERVRGLPALRPVTEMQVKSLIARPRAGETVRAGMDYRVHGAAWTGDADIRRVEVSTDGGRTWADAQLVGRSQRFAWRLWEYTWRTPANAGMATLMCRATDTQGRTQPATHDPDRRNYMISHVLAVQVRAA